MTQEIKFGSHVLIRPSNSGPSQHPEKLQKAIENRTVLFIADETINAGQVKVMYPADNDWDYIDVDGLRVLETLTIQQVYERCHELSHYDSDNLLGEYAECVYVDEIGENRDIRWITPAGEAGKFTIQQPPRDTGWKRTGNGDTPLVILRFCTNDCYKLLDEDGDCPSCSLRPISITLREAIEERLLEVRDELGLVVWWSSYSSEFPDRYVVSEIRRAYPKHYHVAAIKAGGGFGEPYLINTMADSEPLELYPRTEAGRRLLRLWKTAERKQRKAKKTAHE